MIPAYKLYGAAISLYTGKARAYLRYRNIPFVEEQGSPEIFERVGFRMIPVLHSPAPNSGDFLPDDEVPETLLPLLEGMFAEAMPALMASLDSNAAWIDANQNTAQLPRGVGEHEFTIGGRRGTRTIRSYSQWMLQRPLDHYHSLDGADRMRADQLLGSVGGVELMQCQVPRRVARRNNRLVTDG